MQEQKRERRVAKSKSTAMNLSSHVPASSSSAKTPIASKSPGILTAQGKPESRMRKIQSPTQRRVLKRDCKMHTLAGWWTQPRRNLSLQKRNQGMWTFPNLEPGVFKKRQSWGDPLATGNPRDPVNQTAREDQKLKEKNGHTILKCLQPQVIIRKQYSRSSGRSTDENTMTLWMICTGTWLFWGISLNATLRAALHLGQDYFILDKTMRWIYDTWRIIFGTVWDSYSAKLEDWSVIKKKSLV